jgi:ubiquinone/menaquinone biosynthesis C-methylase UbiE
VVEPPLVVDLLARRGQDHDRGLERALLGLDPPGDAVAGLDLGAGHGPGAQEVLELVAAEGVAWAIDWNRGRASGEEERDASKTSLEKKNSRSQKFKKTNL